MKSYFILKLIIPLIFFFCIIDAQAQWSTNPSIDDSLHVDNEFVISYCSDGNGGLLYSWQDENNELIYVNRKDSIGNFIWGLKGVFVDSAYSPFITEDGQGGCYVSYTKAAADHSFSAAYCEHFNANGNKLWANPVLLFSSRNKKTSIGSAMLVNNYGNGVFAIVGMHDSLDHDDGQLLDFNGNAQWGVKGKTIISTKKVFYSAPIAIQDGIDGFVIEWIEHDIQPPFRNELFAQRIDKSGEKQWGKKGMLSDSAHKINSDFDLIKDKENNFIYTWDDVKTRGIYVQKIDLQGNFLWGKTGVNISNTISHHQHVCSDNSGGAYIAWIEAGKTKDAYKVLTQHLDGTGNNVWQSHGITVAHKAELISPVNIISDGETGARVFWSSAKDSSRIHLQDVDAAGNFTYPAPGEIISCTGSSLNPFPLSIVSSDNGEAIIIYFKLGTIGYNQYARKVPAKCSMLKPRITSVITSCNSNIATITWNGNLFDTYELRYRNLISSSWINAGNVNHINAYTISNLHADTRYLFSLRAICDADSSKTAWSNIIRKTAACSSAMADKNISQSNYAGEHIMFSISPNPAHTSVNILFDRETKTSLQLLLSNATGKLLQEKIIAPFTNSISLDVHQLQTGVYFITMMNGEEKVIRKLVIQ
ncbi:MAG: T9SS type A sorting domain-containing protein [Parafilimonas sp.]